MQFDDDKVDASGVEDRRGASSTGGGPLGSGSGGLLAMLAVPLIRRLGIPGVLLVVVGLVVLSQCGLLGSSTSSIVPGGVTSADRSGNQGSQALEQRCNADGSIDRYDDCYLVKVYDETNEVWSRYWQDQALRDWRSPRLVFFTGGVQTGCGTADSQVGPFYCPSDERIYLDIDFLNQLQQQLGAQGRYAQAYILAHEYGHHLQTVLGIEPQVRRLQQQNPAQANALSVRMELQADCFAGAWGRLANDQGNLTVTPADVAEAQRAAASVGDDRLQQRSGGGINQDSWTHGSSAQRQHWYTQGYDTGGLNGCNTFQTSG